MDATPNPPPEAATDEPASPETLPAFPLARVSAQLPDCFAQSLEAALQPGSARAPRRDGWTPERIRAFLTALSQCGTVAAAAEAAGISFQSAYNFRNRAGGRAFHLAWEAAARMGRRRLADEVASRAMHGCVEVIVRDGKVWGERHRYDNRLSMSVLARLDQQATKSDSESKTIRLVEEEFDQFLDIVCAGDGDAAARFLEARKSVRFAGEGALLERLENYKRYGVGHPEEIDVSDLEPERMESWTEEQAERAERAGLVEALAEDDGEEGDDEISEWSEEADHSIVVPEGTRVRTDGTVLLPDGSELSWNDWFWEQASDEAEEEDKPDEEEQADDEADESPGPFEEES